MKPQPRLPQRLGITLLEVLVACGLLVLGLAGIAALLPAAAARLNEASIEDRASSLLANARAEIVNRQLNSLITFQSAPSPGIRTACLGELQQRLSLLALSSNSAFTSTPLIPAAGYLATRIDGPSVNQYRSFRGEDALRYSDSSIGAPVAMTTGTLVHETRSETSWGGLLTPLDFSDTPIPYVAAAPSHPALGTASPNRLRGIAARLDVAVFKKPLQSATSTDAVLLLTATSGGFTLAGTTVGPTSDIQSAPTADIGSIRKRLLAGCSYVLAVPPPHLNISATLPEPMHGSSDANTAGLNALSRRLPFTQAFRSPTPNRKLTLKHVDTGRNKMFFLVGGTTGDVTSGAVKPLPFSLSDVAILFDPAAGLPCDSRASRTKTVGAYTICLPTAVELQALLRTMPSGWPTTDPQYYWTATRANATELLVCKVQSQQPEIVLKPADVSTCWLALEVAIAPTWYRINSSWDSQFDSTKRSTQATVIFSDPLVNEFPRNGNKLQVFAFEGLIAVESTGVFLE